MGSVYQWKEGFTKKADPNKVADELESLPEKTAESALMLAEDEKTELHKCATWDDARAAHLYRLEEMRSVIRSIVIVDEAPDREPIQYRAFEYVTITTENKKSEKRFMATSEALTDKSYRKEILSEIKRDISQLSSKAKMYRYLAEHELDTVQKHLEAAGEAVEV